MSNPFNWQGLWYWRDEAGIAHGPYSTEADALFTLLRHMSPAPLPWYKRWWSNIKEVWNDSKG